MVCLRPVAVPQDLAVQVIRSPARDSDRDLGTRQTGVYRRAMTGLGQVRALSLPAPLRQACPDVDLQMVRLSVEVGESDLDNDLLVIGGPKNNR